MTGIGASTYSYDAEGRLAKFSIDSDRSYLAGDYTLVRDAQGRVSRELGPHWARLFEYDSENRVTKVTREVTFEKLREMYHLPGSRPAPTGPDAISAAGARRSPDDIDMGSELEMGSLADELGPKTDEEIRELVVQSREVQPYIYDAGRLVAITHNKGIDVSSRQFHYVCKPGP